MPHEEQTRRKAVFRCEHKSAKWVLGSSEYLMDSDKNLLPYSCHTADIILKRYGNHISLYFITFSPS
jgi:hypothetical protein